MNYSYIKNFEKSRDKKIGASDIAWCIPHPEIQTESLAAYTDEKGQRHHCTALDLYNEKINGKKYFYSFPADMGHYLEGKALFEFISDNISNNIATEFLKGYILHKIEKKTPLDYINPEPFNTTIFMHNTEAITNYGVAHADCIYKPNNTFKNPLPDIKLMGNIKKNDLIIDFSKPFIIEAKSARLYTVDARKNDKYKGYDLKLKKWQGIPLKVYFQLQYQMALYQIDMSYLSLIFDTSQKYYWQIKANKKHQKELIQIAEYMKQCIDSRTPPKQLLMNSKDIQKLYPEIQDDFRQVSGKELDDILEIAVLEKYASAQEKLWKRKKEDAQERISIHLKDTQKLKGIVDGELKDIAKWRNTGGGNRILGLGDIEEREDNKRIIKYLEKNKLIYETKKGRKPSIIINKDDLDKYEWIKK